MYTHMICLDKWLLKVEKIVTNILWGSYVNWNVHLVHYRTDLNKALVNKQD